jgi:hypothetical protein
MGVDVVRPTRFLAIASETLRLVISTLGVDHVGELMRDRREVALLADLLECLVAWPQLAFGGHRIALPHVNVAPPEGDDPDPLPCRLHDLPAPLHELDCFSRAALHGDEMGEPCEDRRPERGSVRCLLEQELTTHRRPRSRSGTQQQRDDEPLDDLPLLEGISGDPGVRQRSLRRFGAAQQSPTEVVALSCQPPGTCETQVVSEVAEGGDRLLGSLDDLLRRDIGLREQAQ